MLKVFVEMYCPAAHHHRIEPLIQPEIQPCPTSEILILVVTQAVCLHPVAQGMPRKLYRLKPLGVTDANIFIGAISRVHHVTDYAPYDLCNIIILYLIVDIETPRYPNEKAPLNRGITINSTRKGWSFKQVTIFVILAIGTFALILLSIDAIWHKPTREIDPIERERQRKEWEREWRKHQREHEEWERERKQREREREHKRQQDRQREEEEHRRRKEEEHRRREEENRRHREEEQRREQDRKRQDQERRDEKERVKLGLYWDKPTPAKHCASYGVREYTARIWNVPMFYDWLKACQQTPIVIHNKTMKTPNRCEDQVRISSVESRP